MADPKTVLEKSRTIAVYGASNDPEKPAHRIPQRLQKAGYRIVPINPNASEVLGEKAYPRLADVPEPVDVVEVFRPADEAPRIAREAVEAGASAVWLQLDLRSDEARAVAEGAGLDYVEDQCMGVVLARSGIKEPGPGY